MKKVNEHGIEHAEVHNISKGKPVIRIKNVAGIRYRYIHVRGDLNPIITSERMGMGGYLVKLSIGLELYQRFA